MSNDERDREIRRLQRRLERERSVRRQTEELLETRTRELFLAMEELQAAQADRLERDRLARELALAEELQTALLPANLRAGGIEVAARMSPAEVVAGDYYDLRASPDGLWIAMGDVVGHGMNAGLVMMMAQSATAALLASYPDTTPSDAVVALNRVLFDNIRGRLHRDDYLTMTLLRYYADGRLVHAGAHEDIVVCRAATGQIEMHPTSGTWLAAIDDVAPVTTDTTLTLNEGDTVVLYTDGLVEGANENGEQFGTVRLQRACAEALGGTVEDIVDHVMEAGAQWRSRTEDDVAVLVLRHAGGKETQ